MGNDDDDDEDDDYLNYDRNDDDDDCQQRRVKKKIILNLLYPFALNISISMSRMMIFVIWWILLYEQPSKIECQNRHI